MSGNIDIGVPWPDVNATTFSSSCTAEFILVGMISIPEEFEPELARSIDLPATDFSIAAELTMAYS
jgi:hypothetical protein